MYADAESRGGILEPEGIVQIKFSKKAKISSTMSRIDPKYRAVSALSLPIVCGAVAMTQHLHLDHPPVVGEN